jgi:uncharacterized protein YodC (DUF2158 family)
MQLRRVLTRICPKSPLVRMSNTRGMTERNISAHSTVRLKGGGPQMLVQVVANDQSTAYCTWLEGDLLRTRAFSLSNLQVAEPAGQLDARSRAG